MRRVAVGLLALGIALAPMTARASSVQVVKGQVTVPTPNYVGPVNTVACGLLDAAAQFVTRSTNGVFAHRFKVDPATRGLPFVLQAHGPADVDIDFLASGGYVTFESKGFGGERGVVPAGARSATVCLDSGAPAAFTYTAG